MVWLNYEIIYFYNVYGQNKSLKNTATVIGIFEYQRKIICLVIVRPDSRKDDLHIDDTISVCIKAWKENKSSISFHLNQNIQLNL